MKKIIVGVVLVGLAFGLYAASGTVAQAAFTPPDPKSVAVGVTANTKVDLNVTPASLDFGAVDPGLATPAQTVTVDLKNNVAVNLVVTATLSTGTGLDVSALQRNDVAFGTSGFTTGYSKGVRENITDSYTVLIPYTADPGAYGFNVTYTVTGQ